MPMSVVKLPRLKGTYMFNYQIIFFISIFAVVFLLAKQLQASEKMRCDVSEMRTILDRQSVYLKYSVLYARHASDLSEDAKSAFDINMDIELQCLGLDAEQAARLDKEKRKAWKDMNEFIKDGSVFKK